MGSLKERLKNGETVFGTWSNIPSSSMINAICASGIDFVVIDAEHGPVSFETAEDLIRAAQSEGVDAVIRVPSNESHLILRALDIGSDGVQVPHVSTQQEAELVIKYSKYHPIGERGLTPFTRAGKYGLNAKTHAQDANEKTLVVINVEGVEGLNNLEHISKVKHSDVIFIGPYDLSQSLGKPGEVDDPQVVEGIRRAVEIAKSNGQACGSYARDMKYLDILIDCGVQYITYTVDSALVANTYKILYNEFLQKKKGAVNA